MLTKRLLMLSMVLTYDTETAYSKDQKRILTIGQRICINQERAFLISEKDGAFKQKKSVNEKIDFIINRIDQTMSIEQYAMNIHNQQFR